MTLEPELQALLSELQEWGCHHDERQSEQTKKMLNLNPETALLVSILVRSSRRTRLLEIGTSNGYSTIWLAWSARVTGGHVVSIDHSADKLAMADANLHRAGLRHLVDLRHGDAAEVIGNLSGPFDFVLIDSPRASPHAQLQLLLPKLAENALLVADNVLSHPEQMEPYLSAVAAQASLDHVIVPVGKGLSLAYKSQENDDAQP